MPPGAADIGLVEAELSRVAPNLNAIESGAGPAPGEEGGPGTEGGPTGVSVDPVFPPPSVLRPPSSLDRPPSSRYRPPSSTRVAVLSFLFNWPSTGGGKHAHRRAGRFSRSRWV